MKAETLRNAVHAHGWLGLLISVPLFIIFWAGAITLFHPELERWAAVPHEPVVYRSLSEGTLTDLNALVDKAIVPYNIEKNARISLRLPTHEFPFIRVFFRGSPKDNDAVPSDFSSTSNNNEGKRHNRLYSLAFHPYTGDPVFIDSPFQLADFLYQLHYNLKLPQGLYVVGLITLFFFVLVFTGVIVQLKNLIKAFFQYRRGSTMRNRMNDLHNVVGVISLPYAAMYALTGLMFNLSLLLQIPAALVLYQGNIDALTKDAGFYTYNIAPTGNTLQMDSINDVVNTLSSQTNAEITAVNLHNWQDETAVYRLVGKYQEGFAERLDLHYEVKSASFPDEFNYTQGNVFASGRAMLFSMHFADFAGVDLRFLYFILALGVCAMIVAGNVLWFVKRKKQCANPRTFFIMQTITVGGCIGVMVATAGALLLERTLSIDVAERASVIQYIFAVVLFVYVVTCFWQRNVKQVLASSLLVFGVLLLMTTISDWVMFSAELISLWRGGDKAPLALSLAIGVFGGLSLFISIALQKTLNRNENEVVTKQDKMHFDVASRKV